MLEIRQMRQFLAISSNAKWRLTTKSWDLDQSSTNHTKLVVTAIKPLWCPNGNPPAADV